MNQKGEHHGCQVIETNGEALVNAVTSIPGKLHLCIEEGLRMARSGKPTSAPGGRLRGQFE